jgi:formylglycine-generating enzyme required for sulfatase activity
MSGASGNGGEAGAKGTAESKPPAASSQASAAPAPRNGRAAGLVVALLVLTAGGFLLIRALATRPRPPVASAAPLTPVAPVDVPDGVMVEVPGGTFQMGSTEGDPDEAPVTAVTVTAFAMDATEVTVTAFARCVTAGKCSEPDTGMYCNWHRPGRERHPVNCVDLKQATDYCASVEKRLPTEEEWEYAARGTDGRRYPWKETEGLPQSQLCWNGEGSDLGKGQRQSTCPVASFPSGRSPFGAFDMAGNVWEWTASAHCPYTRRGCGSKEQVVRGGAWNNVLPQYVRAQHRAVEAAVSRRDNVGFRCVGKPS